MVSTFKFVKLLTFHINAAKLRAIRMDGVFALYYLFQNLHKYHVFLVFTALHSPQMSFHSFKCHFSIYYR